MLKGFDFDQLAALAAIADTGSFTRAAAYLGRTQPAISMQMKRLEAQVGRPLLERSGRACSLTEDGEKLLRYARRIIQLNNEALVSVGRNPDPAPIHLGIPDDYASSYLPTLLRDKAPETGRFDVMISCASSTDLVNGVNAGAIDLAIITCLDEFGAAEVIREERMVWVASHRFRRPKPTSRLFLALGHETCLWRKQAVRMLEQRGFSYTISYVTGSAVVASSLVLANLAVSVLPECAVQPGMRVLTPDEGFGDLSPSKIALIRTEGASEAAKAFARTISARFGHVASRSNSGEAAPGPSRSTSPAARNGARPAASKAMANTAAKVRATKSLPLITS
ncbi:MAG TPA: LysR family transcriptional regulator [Arenibaculum sp.]|nr:LysR family transcriptional regulator [Arenibaculum sp.]